MASGAARFQISPSQGNGTGTTRAPQTNGSSAMVPGLVVNMSADDQAHLNHFARLHQHYNNLKKTIESLQVRLTRFEDTEEELMMAEDPDHIMTVMGTGFVPMAFDDTTEWVGKIKARTERQIDEMHKEMDEARKLMDSIRADLEPKFEGGLRLEYD